MRSVVLSSDRAVRLRGAPQVCASRFRSWCRRGQRDPAALSLAPYPAPGRDLAHGADMLLEIPRLESQPSAGVFEQAAIAPHTPGRIGGPVLPVTKRGLLAVNKRCARRPPGGRGFSTLAPRWQSGARCEVVPCIFPGALGAPGGPRNAGGPADSRARAAAGGADAGLPWEVRGETRLLSVGPTQEMDPVREPSARGSRALRPRARRRRRRR